MGGACENDLPSPRLTARAEARQGWRGAAIAAGLQPCFSIPVSFPAISWLTIEASSGGRLTAAPGEYRGLWGWWDAPERHCLRLKPTPTRGEEPPREVAGDVMTRSLRVVAPG